MDGASRRSTTPVTPPPGPGRGEGGRRALGPALAAAAIALAAAAALARAWPLVPNRRAFGWDAALRTVSDLDAASGPLRFLVRLLGPEVWPTLRLAAAAPMLALGAPPLPAEAALSIAASAATFLLLGLAAARGARGAAGALAAVAVAAGALAANRAFTAWAGSPMLEAQSALLTLAATVAWMRLREGGPEARVWPVALAGNLLFHTKFQYGLIFAIAVLATEAALLPAGARARAAGALLAEGRGWLRRPAAWLLLAGVAATAAAAWAVDRTGGVAFRVGPVPISVRRAAGPAFWSSFLAFYGLLLGLWRSRAALREAIPARLRGLFAWLAVPMGAWLLVPFAWRLRMLVYTAATFEVAAPPPGPLAGLAFYPAVMARDWYRPAALAAVAAGLLLAGRAAARDPVLRRRLAAPAALVAVELLALGLGARHNFQPRFAVNLAPVVALAAAAAFPAAGRLGTAGGALLAALLAAAALPAWRPGPLAATLTRGYGDPGVAAACEALARDLPLRDATLVADLDEERLKDCVLQVQLQAFRRRVRVAEWAPGRPLSGEVIQLTDRCDAPAPVTGPRLERREGPLCLRIGPASGRPPDPRPPVHRRRPPAPPPS